MKRIAFKMLMFPGMREEYKKRHDEIWPELVSLLKETGISEYSIFLDAGTNSLFGVMKVSNQLALDELPQQTILL